MTASTSITAMTGYLSLMLVALFALVDQHPCHAWISSASPPPFGATQRPSSKTVLFSSSNVESISLASINNHDEEGQKLAESIARWLDAEWMPQEVHVKMGLSAKKSYIACRESGEHDLMTIMTTVADDLTNNWNEYDADAFVNAWNIANYCSDYLVQLSGSEACDCNSEIH